MFVRGVIASCLALVAVAALPTEAQPHAWTDFYDTRWRPEARPVKWVVAPSIHLHFPEWMPYIKHGANQWNAIGSTMQFAYGGLAPGEGDDCGLAGLSLVRRQDTGYLPDGRVVWADTTVCPDPVVGPPTSFLMRFTTRVTFYAGALDPPADQPDIWAVASHEFGHATGWKGDHYKDAPDVAQLCDEDSQRKHTMCESMAPSNQRMRTLEEHDVYTFFNAYPRPDKDAVCLRCPIGS